MWKPLRMLFDTQLLCAQLPVLLLLSKGVCSATRVLESTHAASCAGLHSTVFVHAHPAFVLSVAALTIAHSNH
jgi:hypothetical protein